MARELARLVLVALLVASAACDEQSVFTDIDLVLPPGDGDALRDLSRIEIDVWSPSAGACLGLQTWALEACGAADCGPAFRPTGEPLATIALERDDATGSFGSADLPVPGDGPWQLLVRGIALDGSAFLAGCEVTADSGERIRVRMFRPWCDARACASQFHPACSATIDCAMIGDLTTAENPPCESAMVGREVYAWEQDGVGCAPATGEDHGGNCRTAIVICESGRLDPITDGICPVTDVDEMCGGEDLNCDGVRPGPCVSTCTDPDPAECGDAECYETPVCTPDGGFECVQARPGTSCARGLCCSGTCVDLAESEEHCGACGVRCEGECIGGSCMRVEPMCTVDMCNAGRAASRPRADACGGPDRAICMCGDALACGGAQVCCDGACRDDCSSDVDAGGPVCAPRLETCGGGDEDCDGILDDVDSDAVQWCNRKALVANGCTRAGICTCEDDRACSDGFLCCRELGCIDVRVDLDHCGRCGLACRDGQVCAGGVCRTR